MRLILFKVSWEKTTLQSSEFAKHNYDNQSKYFVKKSKIVECLSLENDMLKLLGVC